MNITEKLSEEAKRIEEDAIYSSKSHYEAARNWRNIYLWLGIPAALIAGVSGVSAFEEYNHIAGFTAIIVAALTSISTFLNPSEKAQAHYTAGLKFTSLKNRTRNFYEIELVESQNDNLKEILLSLSAERDSTNETSPQIPRKAFLKARKGIEEGETKYSVDNKPN